MSNRYLSVDPLEIRLVPNERRENVVEGERLQTRAEETPSLATLIKRYRGKCTPLSKILVPEDTMTGLDLNPYQKKEFNYVKVPDNRKQQVGADLICYVAHLMSNVHLTIKEITTCFFSLWAALLPESAFQSGFLQAARRCGWDLEPIDSLTYFTNMALEDKPILDEQMSHGYSHEVGTAYAVTVGILLTKQLNSNNYTEWYRRRFESYRTKLGLSAENMDWLEKNRPSHVNSMMVNNRFGSKVPLRRTFYYLLHNWSRSLDDNTNKSVSSIGLTLTKYCDMTHIHLIMRYVVQVGPGILASKHLRAERDDLMSVISQLAQMGELAPWTKLILSPDEVPELQRNRLKMTSHLAVKLATRDQPSLKFYATALTAEFAEEATRLEEEFSKIAPAIPRDSLALIHSEYDSLQSKLLISALQPEMTRVRTAIREIREAENDE